MKATSNVGQLPLADAVQSSDDGLSTEFHALPAKNAARDAGLLNRSLIAAVVIMALVFIWACWDLVNAPQAFSAKPLLAIVGSLAVCLLALVIGVGAVMWNRNVAAKNEKVAQGRDLLLRTLIDNLPDAIYAKDKRGRKILANPADLKNVRCKTEAEVIGKSDFDFFPPEVADKFHADDRKVMNGEAVINREEYFLNDAGEKCWLMTSKLPLLDQDGKIIGLVGIGRDITERKRAEAALHESQALYHSLVTDLPVGIFRKDREGRFVLANPGFCRLKGRNEEEFLGRMPGEVGAAAAKNGVRELMAKYAHQSEDHHRLIMQTGNSIELDEEYSLPDGQQLFVRAMKFPVLDSGGKIVGTQGVLVDITERKRAEDARRQSEERLQEVLRSTRCILNFGEVTAPENWRERVMNEPRLFHWNFPVLNLEAAQEVFPLEVPPGRQYQEVWAESRNPDDFFQMHLITRDAFLQNAPFYRNEFRCTDKHGVEHWMQEFITINKLAENRWQIFGINTDITDLKKSECALRSSEAKLRQFTTQLERSNRELQDFAYVASHDLQEPLRKIVVFGERLKERCGEALDGEPRDYLDRMQKAAARMQTLINDLLTFSRVTSKARPFALVNLAEVAHEVVSDLEARIEQARARVEIGELPVIDAEELQMRQVLQNLIGNALKFRRPEVPPVVTVAARKFSDESGRELCELTVRDNGIGFEEKYLDRIFNVFQRLHSRAEFEGNGMGLAIVKKIALYHGGDVTAKSQPGAGTTFILTLPTTHPKNNEPHNPQNNHEK
jgi:two-component system, LuxR family, sensor kinase FixL